MSITTTLNWYKDQAAARKAAYDALQKGSGAGAPELRAAIAGLDAFGDKGQWFRTALMEQLSAATPDAMDAAIKESAMAQIRAQRKGSRKLSFVTGPRGIEGPMANAILGGGTSQAG